MKNTFITLLIFCSLNSYASQLLVPKQFSSIQQAIDKSESGDTITVLKGTYHESIALKDSIYLIGESAQSTIIRGKRKEPVVRGADYSVIKNLTIENGTTGVMCENTIPTIQNCIIKENKGTGIHCLVTIPDILNNVIAKNEWTGIYCESTRSIKTAIQNNIIAENGYCGLMLAGRSEVLLQNNIFYANQQYGIWAGEESKKSRIIYNNFFRNRLANNFFAVLDRSNNFENPQFNELIETNEYYGHESNVLKGKGKDGVTIGMIQESELVQITTDPDVDGVSNQNDLCKNIPEDIDGFEDQDGCPEFDNDKDGTFDSQDPCPDLAEDFDGFKDDDGCPDSDNDADGMDDGKDQCPNSNETKNGYKDDDGCPDEVPSK